MEGDGIVFYHSYKDFKDNYNSNLAKWQKIYPNGSIDDFRNEYVFEYRDFYSIEDFTENRIFCLSGVCYYDNEVDWHHLSLNQFVEEINRNLDFIMLMEGYKEKTQILKNFPLLDDYFEKIIVPLGFYEKIRPFLYICEITKRVEINEPKYKDFQYSVPKIVNFLLGNDENEIENNKEINNTIAEDNIKFNIKPTELVELVKALYESGTIKGKQKDLYAYFAKCFNVEVNNPSKLLQDIKNRNNGSETLFLDELKTSLFNYITKENRR